MAMQNGAQTVEIIPRRRIIVSAGVGKTNIDEIKWLSETVLSHASEWKESGWAYIADCSKMDPVTPAEGAKLVTMTKKFAEAGCIALGFAEGSSIMLKMQAQKNTENAHTGLPEGHFETVKEALNWIHRKVRL